MDTGTPAQASAGAAPTKPASPGYVVVSGYYGYRNSGDEAILCVLLEQLARFGIHRTYVLTEIPDAIDTLYASQGAIGLRDWESVGLTGLSHLLHGRPFRKLGIQARALLFIYGGGSILRDEGMSWRNLFRLLDDIFIARLCDVPVFFYALGVGPFRSRLGRFVIGLAARAASVITVRDERGAALLLGLGVRPERICVVTDPAFLLPEADPAEAARVAGLEDFLAAHPRTLFVYPTISLTEAPLATDDHLLVAMAAGLSRLCREDGWAVVLVPMEVHHPHEREAGSLDDVTTNRRLASLMAADCAVHCVEEALAPPLARALTRLASLNVTVRLHPMIYAASLGIPSVPLNYDPKVAANAQRFGLGDYTVEFTPGWPDRMVENVRRMARNLPAERVRLEAALPALRDGAAETFRLLADLLRAPGR